MKVERRLDEEGCLDHLLVYDDEGRLVYQAENMGNTWWSCLYVGDRTLHMDWLTPNQPLAEEDR